MKFIRRFFTEHWGDIVLLAFVLTIVLLNWKPGFLVLGNDTYAPEVNPKLSLERYIQNPAWRSYRALGVPSDSEQADIVRVGVFTLLNQILPNWAISQSYVFFSLFLAVFGISQLAKSAVSHDRRKQTVQAIGLVAGVLYSTSLVAAWMLSSPLYAFFSAYAFLPLLLWCLTRVFESPNIRTYLWLYIAVLIHTISGMVPTTFIVEMIIVALYGFFLCEERIFAHSWRSVIAPVCASIVIVFATQAFWILPFASYVKTNSAALTESYINRDLTPNLIENEVKYGSFWNVPRFYAAWMDATNDDGTKQYPFAQKFLTNQLFIYASFMPLILLGIGILFAIKKGERRIGFWALLCFVGWMLLAGINPPFGDLFAWFQKHVPLFKQVFRWQSSKIFPMVAIPLAIIGAYAVAELLHVTKFVYLKILLLLVILGSAVGMSWHYVEGNSINKSSLVKIPQEYAALASYLTAHNPGGRIYLAPESNTLYFRSYSWGFFGSSFLNYAIPNPVIEKALTTGSMESEDAQYILEHAYNAKDTRMFSSALHRYNVEYVLFDGYASRLHNGYFYDPEKASIVLGANPALHRVWQQGKLQLYQVVKPEESSAFVRMFSGHDFRRLNTILAKSSDQTEYVSSDSQLGTLYPFALKSSKISTTETGVQMTSVYTGSDGVFSIEIPVQSGQYVKFSFDTSTYTAEIAPGIPTLFVNSTPVIERTSAQKITIDPLAQYITVADTPVFLGTINGNTVLDTNGTSTILTQWGPPKSNGIVRGREDVLELSSQAPYQSIVEWSGELSAAKSTEVNICIFSSEKQRCVNKNHGISIGVSRSFIVRTDELVSQDDVITAYIRPVNSTVKVLTRDSSLSFFSKLAETKIQPVTATFDRTTIQLHTGDQIQTEIPFIQSTSSYRISESQDVVGPVFHDMNCGQPMTDRLLRKQESSGVTFTSQDCSDKLTVPLPILRSKNYDMALVYWNGENKGGIPLKLTIAQQKSGYKQYEEMLPYESSGSRLGLVPFSEDAVNYSLELFSYGIGPRKSVNTVSDVVFQMIPLSWYSIRLVPEETQTTGSTGVLRINQAIHPLWQLRASDRVKRDSMPVRINGWEQGWDTGADTTGMKADFSSNMPTWIGYAFTVSVGVYLLILQMLSLARKHRT